MEKAAANAAEVARAESEDRERRALEARDRLVGTKMEELPLLGGKVYRDVTIKQVTDLEVRFSHEAGVASIRLEDLSAPLREQFFYNPEAYRAAMEEDAEARTANARSIAEAREVGQEKMQARQKESDAREADAVKTARAQAMLQNRTKVELRIQYLQALGIQKKAELERAQALDARRRASDSDYYYSDTPSSSVMRKQRELGEIAREISGLRSRLSLYRE